MKIIVLVKVVDYIYAQTGTDIANNNIGPDDTLRIINPLDESALEFALRVKDRIPETTVRVLSLGVPGDRAILSKCLAMGADEAVLIDNSNGSGMDAWGRANVLTAFLKEQEFDLLVGGSKSIDGNEGLSGPYTAELLELCQVSRVISFENLKEDRSLVVLRQLEHGNKEVLSCRLPALMTVDLGAGSGRYPSLPGILRSRGQAIEMISMDQLGVPDENAQLPASLTRIKIITNPKPKRKKGADEAKNKSAAARLSFLMKAKKTDTKKTTSRVISGDSEDALLKIEKVLRDNGNITPAAEA